MSNTKHTPGPWKVHFVQNAHTYAVYDKTETMRHIAEVSTPFGVDGDRIGHANANLIAAAPELLEALATFIEYHDKEMPLSFDTDAMWANARAAIAKATGNTI
ncbi:MAG TPA: hypothetical protein PKJ19_08135 [Flavobacteriales bacterium]|nr:hypothetical protein [Flavobacteriales bacterium]